MPDLEAISEFDIITRYFKKQPVSLQQTIQGIGDDAAVYDVSQHTTQLIAVDTLVSGVHFPNDTTAYNIAYKALAVNLSDLAAMGATPAWFTLALTIPRQDSFNYPNQQVVWLEDFSRGLFHLAEEFHIELIGGDTTCGPLTVSIQIAGYSDENIPMLRSGAKVDDCIYVSGTLGDAGAGLMITQKELECDAEYASVLLDCLNLPTPRIALGQSINSIASACIDISDGLLADLDHMLNSSHLGAVINVDSLPLSASLRASVELSLAQKLALSAGDDYELCFCIAEKYKNKIEKISQALSIPLTCIGKITDSPGLRCKLDNKHYEINQTGYDHFL